METALGRKITEDEFKKTVGCQIDAFKGENRFRPSVYNNGNTSSMENHALQIFEGGIKIQMICQDGLEIQQT